MAAETDTVWTIIVAAGTGSRFGGSVPKQFVTVAGQMVVDWSVQAAASVSAGIVIVMPPAAIEMADPQLPRGVETKLVDGGQTRSESVRAGLAAVPESAGVILVHDAARPVASAELFERVTQAVRAGADAVVPVVPVVDTIRHTDGTGVDRAMLQGVQTPQGFKASVLRLAHAGDVVASDDATIVRDRGHHVVGVLGERWNIKVTEPDDELVVGVLLSTAHSGTAQ